MMSTTCSTDTPVLANTSRNRTERPPLGWNSYDCFGCAINETLFRETLDVFCQRLLPVGYQYMVVDNGWFGIYDIPSGEAFPMEASAPDVCVDAYGRYLPSETFFPNGFAGLVQETHERGVKFGLHMMRGIPRKAVELDLPIKDSPYTARDIADIRDTCAWCCYNYGINTYHPGAQHYYDSVMQLLASWGIDFIKYDDIVPHPNEIEAVATAIGRSSRNMVLSLSPGDCIDRKHLPSYQKAGMMRITQDIWDQRADIDTAFARLEEFQDIDMNGTWLDLDMICFGHLMVWNPRTPAREDCHLLAGKGSARYDALTPPQKRTFIAIRALAASPLFMGGDLRTTDEESFRLITHEAMLACNQNGIPAKLLLKREPFHVWATQTRDESVRWFGVFNRSESRASFSMPMTDLLGGARSIHHVESIWPETSCEVAHDVLSCTLEADDVLFLKVTMTPA